MVEDLSRQGRVLDVRRLLFLFLWQEAKGQTIDLREIAHLTSSVRQSL